jgi:small subunit ribosomal protein S8
VEKGGFKWIRITLRYDAEGTPFVSGLERVSKPGKRVYGGHDAIPSVMGGLGLTIVSTPKGLMTGRKARKSGIGGEIVCSVW